MLQEAEHYFHVVSEKLQQLVTKKIPYMNLWLALQLLPVQELLHHHILTKEYKALYWSLNTVYMYFSIISDGT